METINARVSFVRIISRICACKMLSNELVCPKCGSQTKPMTRTMEDGSVIPRCWTEVGFFPIYSSKKEQDYMESGYKIKGAVRPNHQLVLYGHVDKETKQLVIDTRTKYLYKGRTVGLTFNMPPKVFEPYNSEKYGRCQDWKYADDGTSKITIQFLDKNRESDAQVNTSAPTPVAPPALSATPDMAAIVAAVMAAINAGKTLAPAAPPVAPPKVASSPAAVEDPFDNYNGDYEDEDKFESMNYDYDYSDFDPMA